MSDDSTKKERAWLLPGLDNRKIEGGLYFVATPIGNLRDISIRALDILAGVDVILCEDTRVTKKLLAYYGLQGKSLPAQLVAYNDHSADKQRARVLAQLSEGVRVALVSDAGMPLVSDPGYKLARDALDLGLFVTSVPGASAPLAGLQLSGLPSDCFSFIGFLPPKAGARDRMLDTWTGIPGSLIAFETAPRLLAALESVRRILGERDVAVVREITKLFEESRRGRVSDLIAHYEAEGAPKGEIVLVIGPGDAEISDGDVEAMLRDALAEMSTKEAAAHVAARSGRARKELYELALSISKAAKKDADE